MSVLPQFVVVAKTLVQHGVALALRHVFELAGLEIAQTDVFHQFLLVYCDSRSRSSSFCYQIVVRETENRQLPILLPRQRNGRTSTGARQATTALRPHARASSRFAAFSIQKPPTCSLVSRYGPSVISTLPSGCARRDFASLAGLRPPAKTSLTPEASISFVSASISLSISLSWADGSKLSGRKIVAKYC